MDHEGEQVTDVIDADEGGQLASSAASAAVAGPRRLYWWREVLYVLAFYGVYSYIRNQFGSASVSDEVAFRNARHIIRIEEFLHLFHEQAIQSAVLGWHWFMVFWNVYYGSFHFVVTTVALIWMFRSFPKRYPLWRNTLAFTTGFALIGFATFPLMPPRLLPASYGFVDTLDKFGDAVVIRLGRDVEDLEPVRRHALSALRMGDVVRARHVAAAEVELVEGAADPLPDRDRVLHRRHREPLLPRRGRRIHHLGARIRRSEAVHGVDRPALGGEAP